MSAAGDLPVAGGARSAWDVTVVYWTGEQAGAGEITQKLRLLDMPIHLRASEVAAMGFERSWRMLSSGGSILSGYEPQDVLRTVGASVVPQSELRA